MSTNYVLTLEQLNTTNNMFESIQPKGILRRYIKNYHIVEFNHSMDYLPKERVFPQGHATMVFHYGAPSKFKEINSNAYIESNLLICGQQTNYYDLSLSGETGMILIVFKPHGLEPFFNLPINELLNQNLSLSDLIKNEAIILEDQLFNSKDNRQRISYLENFLLKRMIINKDFERVEHAIKIIENSKGQIKTQVIAEETCLGIKQFERTFSKYVGINPKKFASIIRFQNVIQIDRKDKRSLSQIAIDSGYYDQSHFIHDFKSITGLTPKAFFASKK